MERLRKILIRSSGSIGNEMSASRNGSDEININSSPVGFARNLDVVDKSELGFSKCVFQEMRTSSLTTTFKFCKSSL
jgi:hypothetical protein